MKRAPLVTFLAACALSATAVPRTSLAADAQTDAGDVAEARAHYARGVQLRSEAHYAEARAELEQAYSLAPTYRLLYELALASDGQGDRGSAIRYVQRYLAEGGVEIEPTRRRSAEELLSKLRARVALVTVRANVTGDAGVTVDEQPYGDIAESPFVLVPGSRKIWVTKAGYYPASQVVLLKEGDAIDVDFDLKELPRATIERPPAWHRVIAPAIGAIIVAVLAALLLRKKQRGKTVVQLNAYQSDAEGSAAKPTASQTNVIDVDGAGLPGAGTAPLTLIAGVATDVGRVKPSNEDSHLVELPKNLFAVSDGIGGFAGGHVASATAVETIGAYLGRPNKAGALTHLPPHAAALANAVFAANAAIRQKQVTIPNFADMGCTCVAAVFAPGSRELAVVHVGDSRVYRLRGGRLNQLTTDHTMAELGVTGRRAQHLSRALGTELAPKLDVLLLRPASGDFYLLCCDGLSKMLDNEAIARLLTAASSPEDAAKKLVAAANEAGGLDNITALVVEVTSR